MCGGDNISKSAWRKSAPSRHQRGKASWRQRKSGGAWQRKSGISYGGARRNI